MSIRVESSRPGERKERPSPNGASPTRGLDFARFKIDCQYVVQLLQWVSTISRGGATKVRR
jgi:hypothetical protein